MRTGLKEKLREAIRCGQGESRQLAEALDLVINTLEERVETAQRASRAKSDFLAKMSHEIRTPMNAILGMAELILREDTSDIVREHALGVKQAGTNLLAIINDILDLSKIESGKMEIISSKYEFASVLHDVISIVRMRVADTPICFITEIDSHLPAMLIGDEIRVRQILLNLLSNAVKYTHSGYIKLSVNGLRRAGGDTIKLTFDIKDTGIGLREADLPKLFGNFAQFDTHINHKVVGTGLGLAITKNFALAMGGDVTVESVYGEGSTFTVTILQRSVGEDTLAEVKPPDNKYVLVLESNQIYADAVTWSLENLGVPYKLATTAEDFSETVRKENFTFVFVSAALQEEAAAKLREQGQKPALILLAEYGVTGFTWDQHVISLPVSTISIANILNGKEDTGFGGTGKGEVTGIHYTIPGARLLIVDDIRTNLRVAEGLMAPLGAKIDTCLSGKEAIELVRACDYDIVFMDHMMPDMDGIETTAAIRALDGDKYKNLVIIALTANAISGMKEQFLSSGFTDYIAKPIETKKLYDLINKWVPHEKRREAANKQPVIAEESGFAREITIDGIDTHRALNLLGGSYTSYIEVLALYRKDVEERIDLLENVPRTGDELKLFTTQVHAIKSASRSIGADNVSQMAADLETYGKNGDVAAIESHLDAFRQALRSLTGGIASVLADNITPANANTATLDNKSYEILKAALTAKNVIDADRLIAELGRGNYDDKTLNVLLEISNCVLMFDFNSALGALKKIVPNPE